MLVRRFLWGLLAAVVINLALIMIPIVRATAQARVGGGAYWLTFSPLKLMASTLVLAIVLVVVTLVLEWLYRWTFR